MVKAVDVLPSEQGPALKPRQGGLPRRVMEGRGLSQPRRPWSWVLAFGGFLHPGQQGSSEVCARLVLKCVWTLTLTVPSETSLCFNRKLSSEMCAGPAHSAGSGAHVASGRVGPAWSCAR